MDCPISFFFAFALVCVPDERLNPAALESPNELGFIAANDLATACGTPREAIRSLTDSSSFDNDIFLSILGSILWSKRFALADCLLESVARSALDRVPLNKFLASLPAVEAANEDSPGSLIIRK